MFGATKAAGVAEVKALAHGERIGLGKGVMARRNKDGSVSITKRVRVGKSSTDKPVDVLQEVTFKTLEAARKKAMEVSAEAKEAAKVVEVVAAPTTDAEPGTLAAAWEDFSSKVEWSDINRAGNVLRVEKYLATWDLWTAPVASITARQCADLLGPIRRATPSQYRKLVGLLNQCFTQAVGLEWRDDSPMPLAQKLLANQGRIKPVNHHPALTKWDELRELVKAIRNATGEPSVRNALFLQCLTVQRTGEVLGSRWSEFSLDGPTPTWTIPRSRMKITDPRRKDHVLYLSTQCVEWLKTLPRKGDFLFPGRMDADTIQSEAMSKHMRNSLQMRDKHVPHSWRSSLRTLAVREPSIKSEFVEGLLDHMSEDQIEAAYQRGGHHKEVGLVLQWWSDQLLG